MHFRKINQKKKCASLFAILMLMSVLIFGCSPKVEELTELEKAYQSSGSETYWVASTPESQGMDSELLQQMYTEIASRKLDIHHVLILKNGLKVSEANYYPYDANSLHLLNSVTKSFTSSLIGKAIDEKLIEGVDEPVISFFKDRTISNPSAYKDQMQLKHLLTMTSGIDWIEEGNNGSPTDSTTQMWRSDNQIQFMLDLEVTREPGSQFYYSTGGSHLLSGVLKAATGMPEGDYATEKLFRPLGIETFAWGTDEQGNHSGGSRLFLTASDLAKFGELYRNKGKWHEEQILPSSWIDDSTKKYYDTPVGPSSMSGYGYQWWMNPFGGYSARGFGGQFLYVVPESDLVVVFLGSMYSTFFEPDRLMADYILPSIKSKEPIEENPTALDVLLDTQLAVTKAPEPQEVPALNATAKDISGQRFDVESGDQIGLDFTEGSKEAMLHWVTDGETYDVPVGLDGIYRFSKCSGFYLKGYESNIGFMGKWTNDNTFIITVSPTDGDASYTLALTYENGTLTSKFRSNLTGK